jgi:RimJ/RimL family protein N-acetyltransferase
VPVTTPAATARLAFRTWRDDDLPLALALYGDPRVTALVGGPFDTAQITARLAADVAMQTDHGYQYWPLFLHDGTHVGCCGLKPHPGAIPIELGFYLRHEHWGRGYAAEASRAVLDVAFGEVAAPTVFAGHHPDNAGSRRTLEALGFRYTHDELYPPTGLMHRCYALAR